MTAPTLPLEWREDPRLLTGGVFEAAVAWCPCGWRHAVGSYTRKVNAERANEMYQLHREKFCPVAALPPATVYGARLLQEGEE